MKTGAPRTHGGLLRFFLRHWAGTLIVDFALLALLWAYQMWRVGLIGALSILPQLVICLVLIVAVIVVRRLVTRLTRPRLPADTIAVPAQAAKEAVRQGQTVLKDKAEEARGALSTFGQQVREELQRAMGSSQDTHTDAAVATSVCPACHHFVRAGARFCADCGATLPAPCRRCGRLLRPEAKFCDSCGAPVPPQA